MGYIYRENG
jgi:hypothetical protein